MTAAAEFVVEAGVNRCWLDEGARDPLGEGDQALARLKAGSG